MKQECGITIGGDEKNYVGASCKNMACPIRNNASGAFGSRSMTNELIRLNPDVTLEIATARMEAIILNIGEQCKLASK